jgi:tetratricopeptide (TPR) repeat protein
MTSEARHHSQAPIDDVGDEPLSWGQEMRRRRARVRMLIGVIVVVVLVAGIGAIVASAAGHYERGRQAMVAKRFGEAAEEFAAARVLTFSYRDAAVLGKRAQDQLERDAQRADVDRQVRGTVAKYLREGADRLEARDAPGAITALRKARILVVDGPLATTSSQIAIADALASGLSEAGRQALRAGRWNRAREYAMALLLLDPADKTGQALRARGRKGSELQDDLDAARSAARQGRYREALRLARNVLMRWPNFPGAATVVAAARTALAPRPTTTPTPAYTRAPTPAAPVAPPAPKPTPPPP